MDREQDLFHVVNVGMEACRGGTKPDSRSARTMSTPLLVIRNAKAWQQNQEVARASLLSPINLSSLMV